MNSRVHGLALCTAVAGDLDGLTAIDDQRHGFRASGLADGRCDIASPSGERVAFAIWHRQYFSRLFLGLLTVHPGFRRHGIGAKLARKVSARIGGGDVFFTSTNASNRPAQRPFDKLRFARRDTVEHITAGDPEWIYALLPEPR